MYCPWMNHIRLDSAVGGGLVACRGCSIHACCGHCLIRRWCGGFDYDTVPGECRILGADRMCDPPQYRQGGVHYRLRTCHTGMTYAMTLVRPMTSGQPSLRPPTIPNYTTHRFTITVTNYNTNSHGTTTPEVITTPLHITTPSPPITISTQTITPPSHITTSKSSITTVSSPLSASTSPAGGDHSNGTAITELGGFLDFPGNSPRPTLLPAGWLSYPGIRLLTPDDLINNIGTGDRSVGDEAISVLLYISTPPFVNVGFTATHKQAALHPRSICSLST